MIQNRSNNDIQIVLEHFNYDVGKTINAFIEGKHFIFIFKMICSNIKILLF